MAGIWADNRPCIIGAASRASGEGRVVGGNGRVNPRGYASQITCAPMISACPQLSAVPPLSLRPLPTPSQKCLRLVPSLAARGSQSRLLRCVLVSTRIDEHFVYIASLGLPSLRFGRPDGRLHWKERRKREFLRPL